MYFIDHQHANACEAQRAYGCLLPHSQALRKHVWVSELLKDRTEEAALIGAGWHLDLENWNVGSAIRSSARGERWVNTPKLLDDHGLAVVGWSHQEQIGHAGALREGQQILHATERSFRTGIGDPSISANATHARFRTLIDDRAYGGMQV